MPASEACQRRCDLPMPGQSSNSQLANSQLAIRCKGSEVMVISEIPSTCFSQLR